MHQRTHVPLTSRLHPKKSNYQSNRNDSNDDNSKYRKGTFPKSIIYMLLTAVVLIACGEYTFNSKQSAVSSKNNVRKALEKDFDLTEKDKAGLKPSVDDDDETYVKEEEKGGDEKEEQEEDYEEYEKEQMEAGDKEQEGDDDDEADNNEESKDPTYHIIFSTDCSDYQHWQSYLLFYSAYKIKQKGYITRIASGCTDSEQAKEQAWHHIHITQSMNEKFKIHFTPKFSTVTNGLKGDYKFFNKPFGLRHWMEHGEGMGLEPGSGKLIHDDDIIMLLDPDMFLLRPLTHDFTSTDQLSIKRTIHPIDDKDRWVVKHGQPFAQLYGYGSQWQTKIDLDVVTGDADTNAKKVSGEDARWYYPVGPPYLATAKDMYNIAIKWTEFAQGVHKQYPYLLAEMFAYSISAAHLNLPHQPIESLMLSLPTIGIEGWNWIDKIPLDNVCSYDYTSTNLPFVFHYCQRYYIKDYLFAKHKSKLHHFFTCESPLFREVDFEADKNVDYKMIQNSTGIFKEKISKNDPKISKRQLFSVCSILGLMNEASMFLKKNHCKGSEVNYDKSLNLWENH